MFSRFLHQHFLETDYYRNFVVLMITPVAIETIGYRYYIVYAVIAACIPASIYFFYPEVGSISSIHITQNTNAFSRQWVASSRTST